MKNDDDIEIERINGWESLLEYMKKKQNEAIEKIKEFWEALGLDEKGERTRRQYFAEQFKGKIMKKL